MRQYVGIILVRPDGSFVAQHRDNIPGILGPDTWAVPGGAREPDDETLEDTAIREYLEETDYLLKREDLKLLARDVYMTEKGAEVERNIFVGLYDEVQQINCHEGQEIRFVLPRELGELNFYTGHKEFFRRASESVLRPRLEK